MSDAVTTIVARTPPEERLRDLDGARLPDPDSLSKGKGVRARHIVIDLPELLGEPAVERLMDLALRHVATPIDPTRALRTVDRSVFARRRPRRLR